jgi:uncharacterized repeat protein (TIGR03806 family)
MLGLLTLLAGCGNNQFGVQAHLDDHYPDKLSEWRIFTGNLHDLKPNQGVLPYDVNTPLFSDYATKLRTVWMPRGVSGKYRADGVLDLPVGTILSKTFSFGKRLIETRLYIHKANGWAGITYVWNHEQSDALLDVMPEPVPVHWNGLDIDYQIPNVNQCKTCHEGPNDNGPLGVTARNLNREYAYPDGAENQLVRWTKVGYLQEAPDAGHAPRPGADLNSRARAYLDVNCATCHVVGGRATRSGVFLTANESSRENLGVCKAVKDVPGRFDIVPGKPAQSMILDRMQTTDPKTIMPSLGHSVVHREGVELIRDWISAMPGKCA